MKKKWHFRKTIPILIGILIGLAITLISSRDSVSASWFDDAWAYRRAVNFTHNAEITSERRVAITVDTATLISNGKMQNDCDDIRFTDINGALLPFQLTGTCDNAATAFDVVFASINNGNNTAYLYYGNPTAMVASQDVSGVTPLTPSGSITTSSEEKGPSPIAYWKFDEGYGMVAHDSTSTGAHTQLGGTGEVLAGETIRHEINIVDGIVTASGDDAAIARLDTNKYNGTVSYYFEIVAKVDSGTLAVALERISTSTQDATLSFTETSFTRKKTTAFTPPSGVTDYNINLSGGTNPQVKAARIIIIQEIAVEEALMFTETQVEIGNRETGKNNTSPAPLNNPKYWYYDSTKWDGTRTYTASATYKMTGTGNAGFVQSKSNATAANGTIDVTLDSAPTAGNLLVVTIAVPANVTMTMTTSGFTGMTVAGAGGGTARSLRMFYKISDGTEQTITSSSTNNPKAMAVAEYSGIDQTTPLNVQNSQTTASATTHTTPTVSASSAGLVVFSTMGRAASRTWSNQQINSSTSGVAERQDTQTTNTAIQLADKLVGTSGNNTGVATISGAAVTGAAAIAVFNIAPPTVTIRVQEDDGNFANWTNVTNGIIVNQGTATTPTRVTSASGFGVTSGRNYRIVSSISSNGSSSYDVYNAKLIISQSGTSLHKLEGRYLIANTLLSSGTALQNFDTYYDPDEWTGSGTTFYHEAIGANGSTSSVKLQENPNGTPVDVTNSPVTPNNRTLSGALTMPSSASEIDVVATTNNNDVYASSIVTQVNIAGGGGGLEGASPQWVSTNQCVSEHCLYFDGSTTVLTTPDNPNINFGDGLNDGFTTMAWIRPNSPGSSGAGVIWSKGNNILAIGEGDTDKTAHVIAQIDLATTNALLMLENAVELNRWNHIAMTYSNDADDEITIYLNGIKIGESTNGEGAPSTEAFEFVIGADLSANHFHGFIDEFKIFNYERSATEILADFNAPGGPKGSSARFGPKNHWLSDGLVGYWKMDEASWNGTSGEVEDASGNGNNGTAQNGANTGGGKFGKGGNFDGTNDYVNAGSNTSLDDVPSLTTCSWIYPRTLGESSVGRIIGKSTDSGSLPTNGWAFSMAAGSSNALKFAVEYSSSHLNVETLYNSISLNTWHHVCAIWDGTINADGVRIYIDGIEQATSWANSGAGTKSSDASSNLYIGNNPGGNRTFDGLIDETRLYNREISPAEVVKLYNWSPGPVGYWKFDENNGIDVYDSSGNGNTGTLNNSAWVQAKYGSGMSGKIDNVHDFTNVPNPASGVLDFGINDNFTIGFWSKVTLLEGNTYIVHKNWAGSPSTAGYGVMYSHSGGAGNIRVGYSNGTALDEAEVLGAQINNGMWRYVTMVMDRTGEATGLSGLHVYVDGRLRGSDTSLNSTGSGVNSAPLRIGEDETYGEFDGIIDDVRIYNYARSQGQIIEDMNAGHPLGGSPVGSQTLYWKFDEGQGTTANDGSATGSYPGTITSATWTNDGKFDKALNFSATSHSVSAGDVAFVDGATSMTWSLWLNPQSLGTNRTIISKSNLSNQNNFLVRTDSSNSDEIRVYIPSSTSDSSNYYTTSDLDLTTGTWQHLLVVYDGTAAAANRVKVYKDGRAISGSVTGTIPTSLTSGTTSALRVGDSDISGSESIIAYIDEVKIYSAPLTQEQVLVDRNQGKMTTLGALSTTSAGLADNSASRSYCVPGDTTTCNPPIGHWKFDENTGTGSNVVKNTAQNSLHGTTQNMTNADWIPGQTGSALNYNGSNKRLDIGVFNESSGDTSASIGIWLRPAFASGSGTGYGFMAFGPIQGRYVTTSGGRLGFALVTSSGNHNLYTTGFTWDANEWIHLNFVYNGSATYIYVNGVLNNTGAHTGSINSNAGVSYIGFDTASSAYWFGSIDELRYYRYARTPAQVKWDMDRGAPIGHWRFDECSGTNAQDASGNGNHGTITPGFYGQTSVGDCSTNANTMWYNGREGKFSGSLNFDGVSDYVAIPDPGTNSIFDFGVGRQITLSAWIRPSSLTSEEEYRTIMVKGWTTGSNNANYWLGHGRKSGNHIIGFCFTRNTYSDFGCYYTNKNIVNTDSWQHVAATFTFGTGSSIKIFHNGVLQPGAWELWENEAPTQSNDPLWIGADGEPSDLDELFHGQIDDVRIYNYALTVLQIRDIMNHGAVRFGD